MPRRSASRTKRENQENNTRIVPSMLDQLEAMVRHPEFRRLLPLWQAIYDSKDYVGLTAEEQRELDTVPRTRFQIAAMMEADNHWLSRSIEDIKRRVEELRVKAKLPKPIQAMWTEAEASWTLHAVNLSSGDQSNALTPVLPADISSEFSLRYAKESMGLFRENTGLKPNQFCRRPNEDPWLIYDRMREPGATLTKVRAQMFGPYDRYDGRYKKRKAPRSPTVRARVKADLKKVRNAYRYALKVLASLNSR